MGEGVMYERKQKCHVKADQYQRFGVICRFHLQGKKITHDSTVKMEAADSARILVPEYTVPSKDIVIRVFPLRLCKFALESDIRKSYRSDILPRMLFF
jgi:hypothetical protein